MELKKTKKTAFLISILATTISVVAWTSDLRASDDRPFELRIQRQDFRYIPREYSREKDVAGATGSDFGSLFGNQVAAFPMQLAWWATESFRLEGAFYTLNMTQARYNRSTPFGTTFFLTPISIPDLKRESLQLEAYYYFGSEGETRFGLGGGLRGLRTTGESSSQFFFHRRDRIAAYGPQLGVRFIQPLFSQVAFFAHLDVFYMRGNRDLELQAFRSQSSIAIAWGSGGTRAEYLGYDVDVGLTWKLTEGLALEGGYRHENSRFRFKNYFVHQLPYSEQFSEQLLNEFNGEKFSREILRGVYLGIRTKF